MKTHRAVVLLLSVTGLALPAAAQPPARKPPNPPVSPAKRKSALATLLAAPIDLTAFKKKKGMSNSGSFKADRWFYRPADPGFFYQYMLFYTPAGYNEGDRFAGFSIVVYKFGKTVGDFYDTQETLVGIWCRLIDPDLGTANLVGTLESEIRARFGEPFAVLKGVWVYKQEMRALSMEMNGGAVRWFKYARLSRNLTAPDAVPDILLHEGPEW